MLTTKIIKFFQFSSSVCQFPISLSRLIYITKIYLTFLLTTNYNKNDIMRRLLKIMNYAAQLMALIDIGKTIKRWATKNNTTSDGQTKNKT